VRKVPMRSSANTRDRVRIHEHHLVLDPDGVEKPTSRGWNLQWGKSSQALLSARARRCAARFAVARRGRI
jgi:hypothetical protein